MDDVFTQVVDRCSNALESADAQSEVETIVLDAIEDPAIIDAIAKRTKFASLEDLAIHRSDRLKLLAGTLPRGFSAEPHNHNIWSVVRLATGTIH